MSNAGVIASCYTIVSEENMVPLATGSRLDGGDICVFEPGARSFKRAEPGRVVCNSVLNGCDATRVGRA